MIYTSQPLGPESIIGYETHLSGIVPTASTTATGFSPAAPTHPNTYEAWRPTANTSTWTVDLGSAREADYVGIQGDLNGATISIESSTDNVNWTTRQTITGPDARVALALFASVTARYWRLVISAAAPTIYVVYLGRRLTMQRQIYGGHSPITLARQSVMQPNTSERGQFLGKSLIRAGVSTTADYQHLTAAWYRENFDPFVEHARSKPYFFAWRPRGGIVFDVAWELDAVVWGADPLKWGGLAYDEAAYVWSNDDIVPVNMGVRDYLSVSIPMQGVAVRV